MLARKRREQGYILANWSDEEGERKRDGSDGSERADGGREAEKEEEQEFRVSEWVSGGMSGLSFGDEGRIRYL